VTWEKDGEPIASDVVVEDAIVYFQSLRLNHTGTYICYVNEGENLEPIEVHSHLIVGGETAISILPLEQ